MSEAETKKMNKKIINNDKILSLKINQTKKQNDIYHPLDTDNNQNKISLNSKIIIGIELTFLIVTFILAFRKSMQILLKNKYPEIEEFQEKPKKKQIFKSSSNSSDICICTFGKNQNKYINEFIEFYLKIGVDKIFLYDNNDKEGEKFDKVINKNNSLVEILDWRGRGDGYEKMMDDCYKNNYNNYDWLIFYEIDEYIHLKNDINIKTFLNAPKFENCEIVYLNWVYYTDNNLILYDNRTLQERFPYKEKNININETNTYINHFVKSIIKGHGNSYDIYNIYKLNDDIKGCDGKGNQIFFEGNEIKEKDFEDNYLGKYFFKSTEEFVQKLKNEKLNNQAKNESVYGYFMINEINEEKINYIEKKTKLNLTEIRNSIN